MSAPDSPRRNLVFCRVGDASLHRTWIGDPATRSYDVWLDYYGEDAARFAGDPARLTVARDTVKIQRIAQIGTETPEEFARYDAIWFPDDDLSLDPATVERLFEAFHAVGLEIAQPALAEPSFYSHEITLENRSFSVRFTNYVEPMAPVFSRAALATCLCTFRDSISGWGIDYVWPKLLGYPTDRLGIVDAAPVFHTRPIAVSAWYKQLGFQPGDELKETTRRYGVPLPYRLVHFGGLPRGSLDRRDLVPLGSHFAARILRGAPPRFRTVRRFWNRQLQAMWHGRRLLRRRASDAA